MIIIFYISFLLSYTICMMSIINKLFIYPIQGDHNYTAYTYSRS